MRHLCLYVLVLLLVLFSSCGHTTEADGWYVHFMAIPLDTANMNDEHDAILTLPWGYEDKFMFNDTFDQVYGPYSKGDEVEFIVDTPNLNTYKVQLWIGHKKTDLQLAAEGENQVSLVLP